MQPRKHYTYHKLVPMRRYPGLGSGFSTSLSDFALVNSDPAAADEQSEENECPVTSEEEAERDAPSPGRLKSCQKLGVLLVVLGLVGVALRLATYPAASSPRLLAVLHVGPHKTGSTSLQSSMHRFLSSLRNDSYAVPVISSHFRAPKDMANVAFYLHRKFSICGPPASLDTSIPWRHLLNMSWESFTQYVSKSSEENLLMSSEEFDHPGLDMSALYGVLRERQVRIIVTYRRLYDYLRSFHFELNRHHTMPQFVDWFTPDALLGAPECDECADCDACRAKSGRTWEMQHSMYCAVMSYSASVVSRFQQHFSDVTILNLHEPGLVARFYCEAVPHAPHACSHAERNKLPRMNKHSTLAYRELAHAAISAGLTNFTNINLVAMRVAHWHGIVHGQSPASLPKRCLSANSSEKLLEASLRAEQQLLPEWHDAAALRLDFKAASTTSLCSVDTAEVLRDRRWDSFFLQLEQEYVKREHEREEQKRERIHHAHP